MSEENQSGVPPKPLRGLAALSPERRHEIAVKAGKASQASGRAHRFQEGSAEAREAGRKGGNAVKRKCAERKT